MASSHLALFREDYRLCTTEVACDGATLTNGRSMCGPCEEALKRRALKAKPLRGENYIAYSSTRPRKKKARKCR